MFKSTKTYGHDLGLSAAFRQWRADSHCAFIHGYALAVRIEFEAEELDERGWVVDFGSMKSLKHTLERYFDHKLLVAADDPKRQQLLELQMAGLAQVVLVRATGCEAFAQLVFEQVELWLTDAGYKDRVWVTSVEVKEHGANSAIYSSN